jgi:site-specific recombinase XerD
MATVTLYLRGKKNPKSIYARFISGRGIDIARSTNQFVNDVHWDSGREKIKNVTDVPNRDKINQKLATLKIAIVDQFNLDFSEGELIDGDWLSEVIKKHFNRPKNEEKKVNLDHHIYYLDYVRWWLDNKSKTWKTEKNTYLSDKAIGQYESFYKIADKYFKEKNIRLKFKTISSEDLDGFVTYMEDVEKYAESTVARHLVRFRFFCNRAVGEKVSIDVNKNVNERVFVTKKVDILEPYLNEKEIDLIFNYDFSYDQEYDNVRDGLIIGVWTGLRISDFNNQLNITNIKNNYLEIKTSKGGVWTTIPLHPMVKAIIDKRFGMLPAKVSDNKFNKTVKVICRIVGLKEVIAGKLHDAEINRDVPGMYEKYKLVSSHICRRSFATNLFELVPNSVIMSVGGWKTEKMMLHYIKKSKREHADILKKTWEEKYNLKK